MKVYGGVTGYEIKVLNSQPAIVSSPDVKRIQQSLHQADSPLSLPQHLSEEDLRQIAEFANYTYVHYSANCILLSACVHFNIEKNANFLRCENISSPLVGLESDVVDLLVFGEVLSTSLYFRSLEEVSEEVLRRYEVNGEKSCIVSAENYTLPLIGEGGHDFNAVVLLDSENKPRVQYLDAWRTSQTIPSMEQLKSHFPESAFFTVRSLGGN